MIVDARARGCIRSRVQADHENAMCTAKTGLCEALLPKPWSFLVLGPLIKRRRRTGKASRATLSASTLLSFIWKWSELFHTAWGQVTAIQPDNKASRISQTQHKPATTSESMGRNIPHVRCTVGITALGEFSFTINQIVPFVWDFLQFRYWLRP